MAIQRGGVKIGCKYPDGTDGDFLVDTVTGHPCTPCFRHVAAMFDWLREHGWVEQPRDSRWPCGLYAREVPDCPEDDPEELPDHKEFAASTDEEKVAAFKWIVDNRSFASINGQPVDLFSASTVLSVYERLTPENRSKLLDRPTSRIVTMAFAVVSKAQGRSAP